MTPLACPVTGPILGAAAVSRRFPATGLLTATHDPHEPLHRVLALVIQAARPHEDHGNGGGVREFSKGHVLAGMQARHGHRQHHGAHAGGGEFDGHGGVVDVGVRLRGGLLGELREGEGVKDGQKVVGAQHRHLQLVVQVHRIVGDPQVLERRIPRRPAEPHETRSDGGVVERRAPFRGRDQDVPQLGAHPALAPPAEPLAGHDTGDVPHGERARLRGLRGGCRGVRCGHAPTLSAPVRAPCPGLSELGVQAHPSDTYGFVAHGCAKTGAEG